MQSKLSQLIIGLAAVTALSGPVYAADGIQGKLQTSSGTVSAGGTGSWSSFGIGSYSDEYAVSFASLSSLDLTITADNGSHGISLAGGHAFLPASTSSLTETLINENAGANFGATVATFSSSSTTAVTDVFNNLKGNYQLNISTTVGNAAPRSGYSLTTNVAAVPEPTEGALLLSGIGLLGFIASRRKNNG